MYFKIQGTYFKICALYFLRFQTSEKQQLTKLVQKIRNRLILNALQLSGVAPRNRRVFGGKCVTLCRIYQNRCSDHGNDELEATNHQQTLRT